MDGGKDWTWYAALAHGSADLIQGLGLALYKAVVQYTILEEPSARPWFGQTDAEQEREELGV